MKALRNSGSRRLGIPGRPAIILSPDESVLITDDQLAIIRQNKTVVRWMERGVLTIKDNDSKEVEDLERIAAPRERVRPVVGKRGGIREQLVLPDGVTGKGIETHHRGGGWYEVYVNGFKVTDKNIRKAEAEDVAAEYK